MYICLLTRWFHILMVHVIQPILWPTQWLIFSFLNLGSYLYIDTLSPHSDGDAAITYSPSYDLSNDAYCAQFWYYHDGYGFITLHTRQSGVYSAPLWTSPANTVDGWRFGSGTVTGNDVQVRRFRVQNPYLYCALLVHCTSVSSNKKKMCAERYRSFYQHLPIRANKVQI